MGNFRTSAKLQTPSEPALSTMECGTATLLFMLSEISFTKAAFWIEISF